MQLPESRKRALETAISQLRIARKSLLVANIGASDEESIHDKITECIKVLKAIFDIVEVVPSKTRDESEEDEMLA